MWSRLPLAFGMYVKQKTFSEGRNGETGIF